MKKFIRISAKVSKCSPLISYSQQVNCKSTFIIEARNAANISITEALLTGNVDAFSASDMDYDEENDNSSFTKL